MNNDCPKNLGIACTCQESECLKREDKIHCEHWYDGEECCDCKMPAMPIECQSYFGMLNI